MPLLCVMCGRDEESIAQLLLNCCSPRWIWNKVLGAFGLQVGMAMDIVSWFQNRGAARHSRIGKLIWNVLFHAVTWSLWLERNQRIFEEKRKPVDKILKYVF